MENYNTNELYHFGIKGMKWGVRRYRNEDGSLTDKGKKRYRSTGLRSALARRSNEKVDKSFKDWKKNAEKRDDAIALGKKSNEAKMAYERNKSDKALKSDYKKANRDYKKALNANTTYRKGVVKQEVGKDLSRKYLSEAKKVNKQLTKDPSNKQLQKQYDQYMSKHDVERAKARRVAGAYANRSRKIASIKRGMTMTAKAAAASAAVAGGVYTVNRYLDNHQVTLNGQRVRFGVQHVANLNNAARVVKDLLRYF